MLTKILKGTILGLAVASSMSAIAETGFKVPVHYNVELVDGISDPSNYSRFSRLISLTPGKHQVVLTFKDTFRSGSDTRLVQAIDPVVIDIENIKKDQVITFDYKKPANESQAKAYVHMQKITLIDNTSEKVIPKSEAYYYILTSDKGFSLMRDYKQELANLNRLYAPSQVANGEKQLGMTEYGAPTIEANAENFANAQNAAASKGLTMEPMGVDNSAMSTSTSGKKDQQINDETYRKLVNLYNKADDATKLKFMKYVMAH